MYPVYKKDRSKTLRSFLFAYWPLWPEKLIIRRSQPHYSHPSHFKKSFGTGFSSKYLYMNLIFRFSKC